ncbi:hypothetical protein FACS1894137_03790 [Spirochaetia bacterium]|nr:hypothetical protein FACS1894137_03790 [Spirochaetia bacterium]
MRLSGVLSKPLTSEYVQVEGFMNNKSLKVGKQLKISIGKIALNFFCKNCDDERTFFSGDELFCIGVDKHLISIDCVLSCHCGSSVLVWFLVECDTDISGYAPKVHILKRSEKMLSTVMLSKEKYGDFSDLLDKANHAFRDELGAGAIVYLRKIFEMITVQTADAVGISYSKRTNGSPANFRNLLEKVDEKCSIIPNEFSKDGYRLFGELSDVVHGEYDEILGLAKFEALHSLIIGILEKVKSSKKMMAAIVSLWPTGGVSSDKA